MKSTALKAGDQIAVLGTVKEVLNQSGKNDIVVEFAEPCDPDKPDEKRNIIVHSHQVESEASSEGEEPESELRINELESQVEALLEENSTLKDQIADLQNKLSGVQPPTDAGTPPPSETNQA